MNKLLLIAESMGDFDACNGIKPFLTVVKRGVFQIIQIGIPILLIILGTVDLGKAVISSDDKEIKAATGRLVKRIAYAAVIFFMTTIVTLIMNIIATSSDSNVPSNTGDWRTCWSSIK